MPAPYNIEQLDLKTGLKAWTQSKGISITRFGEDMKYIYQHAWNILSGSAPVTVEVVGRFVLAYGAEAAGELLALSTVVTAQTNQGIAHQQKLSLPISETAEPLTSGI